MTRCARRAGGSRLMLEHDCSWPFCHLDNCESCRAWDKKYGDNLDDYLEQLVEIRNARKRKEQS
jgi:predicted anti-sigma-YlaC factor YlaD